MPQVTIAFCTYNRRERLPTLVAALAAEAAGVDAEVLAVDNNSTDGTGETLAALVAEYAPLLRVVTEREQGIVAARNRVLAESLHSEYLVFIDDDELPCPGAVRAALDALQREQADCVGGAVEVDFEDLPRPAWLGPELLGFLAEIDHGPEAFWIEDESTPVWTSNIAYRVALFRDDSTLRFDDRFTRRGKGVAGGEDVMMFRELLRRKLRLRYRPDMKVRHCVEPWRLSRRYFLKLHFRSGVTHTRWDETRYARTIAGVPPFLLRQALGQSAGAVLAWIFKRPAYVRTAMTAANSWGSVLGALTRGRQ